MRGVAAAGAFALTLIGARAEAHIHLDLPLSWTTENSLGDPQKDAPCGGEGGTPSGIVNHFRPGETITVQWTETIYHPGHYRIAFANSRADLREPVVTIDGNQNAVSATIDDPPVYPVLLDNLFPRTGNGAPGSVFQQDITLPNTPCTGCVLQVIQFMEGHGPPTYIYHHCADVDLVDPPPPDGGFLADADPIDLGFDDTGAPIDSGPIDVGIPDSGLFDLGPRDLGFDDQGSPIVPDSGPIDTGFRRDGSIILPPDSGFAGYADAAAALETASGLRGTCACTSTRPEPSSRAWVCLLLLIARRRR